MACHEQNRVVLNGCFYELGVILVGVLTIRALLVGSMFWGPDFGKLPNVGPSS